MMDDWQRRRDEIEEAQRRGELFADVRNLTRDVSKLTETMNQVQGTLNFLAKEVVFRKDFDVLRTEVEGFTVWRKVFLAIMAIIVFLSQVVPRLWESLKP